MDLLGQLQRGRKLRAKCPNCWEEFPLHKALLFHVKDPLPEEAQEVLDKKKADLKDRKAELKRAQMLTTERAETTTTSVNIGKIVEKIAPTFRSFEFSPADCRALFEPIDYMVFPGLAARGAAEEILFIDVKSGRARLNQAQRSIRDVVDNGQIQMQRVSRRRKKV